MSALPKMDDDGNVTLPREIRDAAGLRAGDAIAFRVVGPGRVEISNADSDASEPDSQPQSIGTFDREKREAGSNDWASIEFPKLTIEELLNRYHSDQPYDDATIRDAWESEAGDEIAERIRRGIE